jgi:hypothetical protein
MFGEALDAPLPLATLCHGAMVDVIEQPVDCVTTPTADVRG